MKVYLATSGSYSDFRVQGVFAREEDAAAYELGESVSEYELWEGPQQVRDWHELTWYPDLPEPVYERDSYYGGTMKMPNPYEETLVYNRRHYDGDERRVEHHWRDAGGAHIGCLRVSGWSLEHIRKVFGELRAEWLYCKSLGMVWDPKKFKWTPGEVDTDV
ncbi:hypothetical protein ACIBK9_47200 [Nonomuraea sp. NPDC050227]|uniref:hypothetical protein n=1 Tax=Nonomuraea sp. NPDC050227 TaxID=3364360 RepID=UPI0037972C8F